MKTPKRLEEDDNEWLYEKYGDSIANEDLEWLQRIEDREEDW